MSVACHQSKALCHQGYCVPLPLVSSYCGVLLAGHSVVVGHSGTLPNVEAKNSTTLKVKHRVEHWDLLLIGNCRLQKWQFGASSPLSCSLRILCWQQITTQTLYPPQYTLTIIPYYGVLIAQTCTSVQEPALLTRSSPV